MSPEEEALRVAESATLTSNAVVDVGDVYQGVFGLTNRTLVLHLTRQLLALMPSQAVENLDYSLDLSMALEKAIQPKDELEALLAAQMIGVHNLAMKFMGRANTSEATEVVSLNVERATKFLRTFTAQMEALNRHRGKGHQKVTVEHVTVNHGGQAVIGMVERPAGGRGPETSISNRPHATRRRGSRKSGRS